MDVQQDAKGFTFVQQQTYHIYIDPKSKRMETESDYGNGRAVMHVGMKCTFQTGKFGGEAKEFVVVAVYPSREYDCVVYERR